MQANMLFIDLPLVNEYLVNPNQRLYWVYLCGAGVSRRLIVHKLTIKRAYRFWGLPFNRA